MLAIDEEVFPEDISYGSRGGPGWKTEIVTQSNGYETRNGLWSRSLAKYDIKYGVRSAADSYTVLQFFNAQRGRLRGFRYLDHADCTSRGAKPSGYGAADQGIGTGDGATTSFQLVKTYANGGGAPYVRAIIKPIAVRISVAGAELTSGWTCNLTTGVVVFASAPSAGASIAAGYQFHVPVRFDSDELSLSFDHFNAFDISSIPLIELKL
jgi:uncharacterized protein (TIGR02217 family)